MCDIGLGAESTQKNPLAAEKQVRLIKWFGSSQDFS